MNEKPPLTGNNFVLLLLSLGLAVFMDNLDFSIANVAIPNIAAFFGVTVKQGTWLITLFAVSNTITLAMSGWLAARFGSVRVVVISILMFSLSSLCCGLAWSFESLVFFRILQGIFSGCLGALPQSLCLTNIAEDKKGLATGCLLLMMVLGPVLGPVIGGIITEKYGWPWIFFINVPFGILSAGILYTLLRHREDKKAKIPIDIMGFTLMAIGVGTLQIFLDQGNDLDWFGSSFIILLALVSGISISFFIVWNLYSENPIIDFSLLKNRNFTLGTILSALPYFVLGGTSILIPLLVQTQMGYTPYWAGVVVMPVGLAPIILAPIVGLLILKVSLRGLIALGFLIFALTCFWFSNSTTEITIFQLMMPRLFQGVGIALCFLPLFQMAVSSIKDEDLAQATGLHNLLRNLVGGIGISTAAYVTLWQQREALHHSNLAEVLHPLRQATIEAYEVLSSNGVSNTGSAEVFEYLITNQAYMIAFNDLLWMSGWLMLLFIPFLWFCKEPQNRSTRSSI